ncbi:MAG: ATP-dependent DNA helicase RecG [Pseudomonadota bacterium]
MAISTSTIQHAAMTQTAELIGPVTQLKGVGPRLAARLERLGIRVAQDVLFHLPARYQDRTRLVPIGALSVGDQAVIEGEVQLTELRYGKRPTLLSRVSDGTGSITLRFFHFNAKQRDALQRGVRLRCYGEVRSGAVTLEMVHPEYRPVSADAMNGDEIEETLTPIYPTTEGLHQLTLRNLTGQTLARLNDGAGVEDWLPAELLATLRLPDLAAALRYVHRPPVDAPVDELLAGRHPTQQRLAFEELLAHHLSLRQLRARVERHRAPVLRGPGELFADLQQSLPFRLTGAQQRVIGEIAADLQRAHPMQRLVQGDVGSGKTLVAAAAVLAAVEAGYQAAVMAPTELLAEQHWRNFGAWLAPLGVRIDSLAGKLKASARTAAIARLASGETQVAVGTHALFQDEVNFKKLGLVVIDEQHRFGVHQRLALWEKGNDSGRYPHQLIMTATPIPRTLAMTAYADLDVSVIDELPPGRQPVETVVVPGSRRDEVVQRVKLACRDGRQAYWVCTLIEESEVLQCQAAEDTVVILAEALPDLRVALVHGRMKGTEKEAVMMAFKAGDIDLLVATTVIEVGVDVPNASLMVIENAERLGLAQLHQLRGRVGRGNQKSACVLMYQPPLSRQGRARLATLRETNDGFEIARRDLEIRGPGEVLGTRQSGLLQLKIADVLRDQALIPKVDAAAQRLLRDYPSHVAPLIRRWLGEAVQFGDV